MLYVIDPASFSGTVLNIVDQDGFVGYMQNPTTWEEYNRKRGGKLIAIDEATLERDYLNPYYERLKGDWEEVEPEKYKEMLEILPPARYLQLDNYEVFFVGEPTVDLSGNRVYCVKAVEDYPHAESRTYPCTRSFDACNDRNEH